MTKTDVTNAFNKLEKLDYIKVKTFNSHRKMSQGAKGFCDHLITNSNNGTIYFIEVKLGKDDLSKKQIEFKNTILEMQSVNSRVKYYEVNENNLYDVIAEVLE